MKNMEHIMDRCRLTLVAMLLVVASTAQVSLTTSTYGQNFNGMGSGATAALPTGFRIGTDWNSGTTATTLAAGTTGKGVLTSSSGGGVYNFANGITASSTDRAVGFLNSGSFTSPRSIMLRVDNNTGAAITTLELAFNYEKYRSGSRAWTWSFFHGSTSSASTAFAAGGHDFPADAANTTIFNPPGSTAKSFTLTGLNIPVGSSYYFRWTLTGNGGSTNGQALGIDDFSLTIPPPPLPTALATFAALNGNTALPPLVANAADQVVFAFTASSNASAATAPASQVITALQLATNTTSASSLSNIRLIRSVDADPTTTGDNTLVGTFTLNAGNIQLNGLSQALTSGTLHYFVLANVNANVTPASTPITFTGTAAGITINGGNKSAFNHQTGPFDFQGSGEPVLEASAVEPFGEVCVDTFFPATTSFIITGSDIDPSIPVVVGPLAGYDFFDPNTYDYAPSLTFVHSGDLQVEVTLRFLPTQSIDYIDELPIAGGGTSTSVAVSGSGIDTPPTAVTLNAVNIGLDHAELTGSLLAAGCSDPTAMGVEYSTVPAFVPGTGVVAPAAAIGDFWSVAIEGLAPCTEYYYRAFATNAGGTDHGEVIPFSTTAPPAPTVEEATAVFSAGFTANWQVVPDASGYLLDVSTEPNFAVETLATDLFISEYAEGSSFNKYIEIYNGTGAAVDLAPYSLRLYSNGAATVSQQLVLSGSLASGATIVYKHGSAVWPGPAVSNNTVINFNGNDPVALAKNGVNIDVVGTPGIGADDNFGADKNLVRKVGIAQPSTTYVPGQWDTYPSDTQSTLGAHESEVPSSTPSFVAGYEALPVSGNSFEVAGLVLDETYYYRVRAIIGSCESAFSNTASVVTNCDVVLIDDVTSNSPVCATGDLELAVIVLSGEQPYTFTWTGSGAFAPTNSEQAVTVTGALGGSYAVLVSNGCSTDEASLTISLAADTDGDGLCDELDGCPDDPNKIEPGVCGCGVTDIDTDGDGFADCIDNCADSANADQADGDQDGQGDACDVCPNDPENDVDEDGLCADEDPCPFLAGVPGDACDASVAPGFQQGAITNDCQCAPVSCTENVTVELRTDALSAQASWQILAQNSDEVLCQFTVPVDGITTPITENCCLPQGCYRLRVLDSGGDGFITGGYQLRESGSNGRRIIDNFGNFSTGLQSALASTYENGAFCVPVGDDKLIFSSCDKVDWVANKFIVASENTAVSAQFGVSNTTSGYEFWFFDPNGTYSFRRFRSHATSDGYGTGALRANHFKVNGWVNSVATPHLPANTLLNVRIRGRVNGVNLPFGPACLFKMDAVLAACPRVKLQDDPANVSDYSCGVFRNFGGSGNAMNRIYANPPQPVPTVASNMVRYQFRFRVPGENICVVRPPQTSAQMTLNWNTTSGPQLQCSKTYEVDVRVSLDGGATWCHGPATSNAAAACADMESWGKLCNVTINPCVQAGAIGDNSNLSEESVGNITLYPNPNNGEQVTLHVQGMPNAGTAGQLVIYDMKGSSVYEHTIPAEELNEEQLIPLTGSLDQGVYVVSLRSGSHRITTRMIIVR
ncbi:MAG TPA: lamin tail domain-containing protein [Flavobacteriales bacterium]|nr:lamin tail domain-containing protein [Flavobacteriales bacterium]